MQAEALKTLLTARKRAKNERLRKQPTLIGDEEIFADQIALKLDGLASGTSWENFLRCGKEEIFRTCEDCRAVERFSYKCNLKWCPRCNWRITRKRAELIRKWMPLVHHPKHIVTTQRNFPVLTRRKLKQLVHNLAKLRRSKVWANVLGGCCSIEITNEGNGWHLHAHWLVDATYIDMRELAIVWGKLVQQEFGIVHYDDCSEKDYCNEVCKYVVKGGEMADWEPEMIWEFISAIRGRRFFFQFGTLFKMAPEMRRQLLADKPPPPECECGCSDFIYESEVDAVLNEVRRMGKSRKH